jgi:predicted ATP-grasp superfamily ATP-dependent carboligase
MKTAVLLYSRDSRLIAAFTTEKEREWPVTGGLTAVSRSTRDDANVKQVEPFFGHWKWRGAAEVELKRDPLTGMDKVIEINPRVPAYLRFTERCGLDLAAIAVRLSLKEDVAPLEYPTYRVGTKYVNPGLLIRSAGWHVRRANVADTRGVLANLGIGVSYLKEMLRDPLPIVARVASGLRNDS